VVENFTERLCEKNPALKGHLGVVKFTLRSKCREFIESETDRLAEAAFDRLIDSRFSEEPDLPGLRRAQRRGPQGRRPSRGGGKQGPASGGQSRYRIQ